ncbi:D-3-phosphoglycerate dehydrogenase 2, partial [Cryomyces antarcticus]
MATQARDIPSIDTLSRTVSNSFDLSSSPTATFNSPPSSFGGLRRVSTKQLKPFATQDIKVLLLENVNQTGQAILRAQGYQVEFLKASLPEDKLIEKIR